MIKTNSLSLRHRAALFILAISVAILAIEGWREWSARTDLLMRSQGAALSIARAVAHQADSTFELADQIIAATVFLLEDGFDHELDNRLARMFDVRLDQSDSLAGIYVYDETGALIGSNASPPVRDADGNAVDLLAPHAATDLQHSHFAGMMRDADGNWLTVLSRRLNHPDGSFAGVVAGGISSTALSRTYGPLGFGPHGTISLLDIEDGYRVIAHGPDDTVAVGEIPDQDGVEIIEDGRRVVLPERYGADRFAAAAESERYPFIVLSTAASSDVLAPWAKTALARVAVTLALSIGLLVLALRLAYQIEQRLQADKALHDKEAEFRLLTESASDLVERFDDVGNRLYISPAVKRVLGYSAEELLGNSAAGDIHPEDLPAIQAAAARMRSGESTQETIAFRRPHKDGRELWLETSLRVAEDNQQAGTVVAVTRDITARKQLEQRLHLMARLDGLTGLTNRGTFDEILARETERASRTGLPMALLMLDADRFKRYNDNNGHVAGDDCLRAIADVLKSFARRPDDVAARYGGEEFVLLLPGSDIDAARDTAARLTRQVETLGIPHRSNAPWNAVTVSVGVAVLNAKGVACHETSSQLIERVDSALYRAKSEGRNRFVMARPPAVDTQLVG